MRIGIVIAMDKEYRLVREIVGGAEGQVGTLGDSEIVMARCGIGKVNAAIGATELIQSFHPDVIVSTGVAGGASTEIEVKDVVVSSSCCYHDVYCGPDVAYGQVPGMPETFKSDEGLLHKALSLDCGVKVHEGLIVTGDWFVDSREKMRSILERFPQAMAVDMESAAIAHACHVRGVPFISFRIISDIPLKDHKAEMYFNFWEEIAENSFSVTKAFLEAI